MKRIVIGLLLIAFSVGAYAGGDREAEGERRERGSMFDGRTEESTENYPLEEDGLLIIDLKVGGDIRVSNWDRDEVEVQMVKRGTAIDHAAVEFTSTSSRLRIDARYTTRSNQNGGISFTVRAPAHTSIELNTLGGDVNLAGLSGSFSGKTMGGDIVLRDLSGTVSLETMGGEIDVESSKLDGDVKTMGGEITVELTGGSLIATTMGGDVEYTSSGDASSSPVSIETMGGDIVVSGALSGLTARTMGGNLKVKNASGHARVDTMGGNIDIDEIAGGITATTMGGDIEGRVVSSSQERSDGDNDVMMRTLGGEIVLFVPADYSMEVSVELKTSKKAKRSYRITSDFDLDERTETDSDVIGDDFKSIQYGTGSFNGGRYRIDLSSTDGNVRLEKSR